MKKDISYVVMDKRDFSSCFCTLCKAFCCCLCAKSSESPNKIVIMPFDNVKFALPLHGMFRTVMYKN